MTEVNELTELDELNELISKETFLQRYPEIANDGRVRWWIRRRHSNGAAEAGAIVVIGKRAFFRPRRFAKWILSQDKLT